MSVAAQMRQYRTEMINTFEQHPALLANTVTTEAVISGNEAEFLVSGSGGATAVTRGVDGSIPARKNDNTQTTVTLTEYHDLPQHTRFDVFSSQGDQRALMQRNTVQVINRTIDQNVITALNTATVNTGAAATADRAMINKAKTTLQNAEVPVDGMLFGAITPAFDAYLEAIDAYASADFVDVKPLQGDNGNAFANQAGKMRYWSGIYWCVHPNLPGVGTNAEKCFLYHKSAIGHAMNTEGMDVKSGYDEEQDYYWSRASIFMGTKVIQNSGIVVMNHDGSAYQL